MPLYIRHIDEDRNSASGYRRLPAHLLCVICEEDVRCLDDDRTLSDYCTECKKEVDRERREVERYELLLASATLIDNQVSGDMFPIFLGNVVEYLMENEHVSAEAFLTGLMQQAGFID